MVEYAVRIGWRVGFIELVICGNLTTGKAVENYFIPARLSLPGFSVLDRSHALFFVFEMPPTFIGNLVS